MQEKDIDQKAIRTYEGDIANAIQHQQTSQASMVLANEEKKRQEEKVVIVHAAKPQKDHSNLGKNLLMVLLSLILLAAGIAAVYYFYTISPLSAQQPSTPTATSSITVASIIPPDAQKIIDITGQNPNRITSEILEQSQANTLSNSGIEQIVLGQQASTTGSGKTITVLTQVTGPQFISIMGLVPPEALTSALTNQWMLGIYSDANNSVGSSTASTSTPFIILTNNFFQNAFAGMLAWEPTMASEFSSLFGIQSSQWANGNFQDKLVKNKNVREFTDNNGNTLFLYSFINNSTLVIAQNEAALSEIINRFENQAYMR